LVKRKTAYGWVGKNDWARVTTFSRIPKHIEDADGHEYDFEALVLDPRNWRDRTEQTVFQHIIRQLGSWTNKAAEQRASGNISLNAITKHTGMDSRTITKRLRSLQQRGLLTVARPTSQGEPPPYFVALNLHLCEWRGIAHYHRLAPDEANEATYLPWPECDEDYAGWW